MRRTIAAIGRTLVTLGLLILLFVGYQLWGTGIFTARAQNAMEDDLAGLQEQYRAGTSTTVAPTTDPPSTAATDTTATTTAPATTTTAAGGMIELPPIGPGDPLGRIQIPRIGVDQIFVQGTSRDDLKKGPGHYPLTPLPGQIGNAAVAGHRTTYGAPFNRLDELNPGDEILTDTITGSYVYVVYERVVVQPTDIQVVANTPDAQLTLTTCNPEYSARERLVVKARLKIEKSDVPFEGATFHRGEGSSPETTVAPTSGEFVDSFEEGLEGDPSSRAPALGWGLIAGLVGLAWWWTFRRWRHPFTWLAGVGPFVGVLFVFYVYLERLLPSGY